MKTSFELQVAVILSFFILARAGFVHDMLAKHNYYRSKHGTPALRLNAAGCPKCVAYAQELAKKDILEHSDCEGKYGENLCYTTSNPVDCVSFWYDEIIDYNFDTHVHSPDTEYFTQLIWRDSKYMAVGMAKGSDGKNFVVARYIPPGNVPSLYQENVPRRNIAGRLFYDFRPYLLTRLMLRLLPDIQDFTLISIISMLLFHSLIQAHLQ